MGSEVVAWISRREPLPAQIEALRLVLGEVDIKHMAGAFRDASKVIETVRALHARYAVVVLPLSMISELTSKASDITWLHAEMEPVHVRASCEGERCLFYDPVRDILPGSLGVTRHLRFREFKVIRKVEMVLEPFHAPDREVKGNV